MPRLAEEAGRSPAGAKGVIVLPYFSGERTPIHDPYAKGMIFGLDLTHTRDDLYRGLIEGIGYAVRHIVETYESAGQPPQRLIAVGGGTKNAVWLGAVSDICRRPQQLRRISTGASYGDAFLAAVATGHAALADIERWNAASRTQEPDAGTGPIYDRQYAVYKGLYERTRELMHELSA
jgi:xylulokinase